MSSNKNITLSSIELERIIERAVTIGIRKAMAPYLSRRQAEKEYGRAIINNLIEKGLIEGYRQGPASNSKVLFERDAIERAISIY